MIINTCASTNLLTDLKTWLNYEITTPDVEVLDVQLFDNHKISDIRLTSGDISVNLYVVEPAAETTGPGIHFIHWLETHAENSNRTQFLPMAIELTKQGIVSVLPDCFWSVNKEDFDKNPRKYMDNWWKTDEEADMQLIKVQLLQLKLVEEFLLAHPKVNPNNVGLGAHDFGAMFACLLAALGAPYKVYAFMAMTSKFSDWFRFGSELTDEELQLYVKAMSFTDPIAYVANIAPAALQLGFADDDFYVPKQRAQSIFDAAGEPKQMIWYHAKHDMNPTAFEDLTNWLTNYLLTSK